MDAMPTNTKPKRRRWFRFKLSSVLIVTAIAAWAMALRPEFDCDYVHEPGFFHLQYSRTLSIMVGLDTQPGPIAPTRIGNPSNFCVQVWLTRPPASDTVWWTLKPKSLVYPALALVAFGFWKWIRRRRSAAA